MTNKKKTTVEKKTFIALLIIQSFIFLGICYIAITDIINGCFNSYTIFCEILLLIVGVFMHFFAKPLIKRVFQEQESAIESKKYVMENLSESYCVEVIPIKDEEQHEKFLTVELPKRAKFYAQIMTDETIMISIKFNNEDKQIYYGGMYSTNFTKYFKVKSDEVTCNQQKFFTCSEYRPSENCINHDVYELCYKCGACGRRFGKNGKLL